MRTRNALAGIVLGVGLAAATAGPARAEETREPLDARPAP